jgi:phenylacetic acid degradation protein
MTVRSFGGKTPRIGEESYVHASADVFGDVTIGQGCWIGPGARLRGDEDNCVIHARPGETTHIGNCLCRNSGG